jgi:hypothetical protein
MVEFSRQNQFSSIGRCDMEQEMNPNFDFDKYWKDNRPLWVRIKESLYYSMLYVKHRILPEPKTMTIKLPIKGWWCDKDHVLFFACFEILKQFVTEELGEPTNDVQETYKGFRLHSCSGSDEKAIDLYIWYRDDYPEIMRRNSLEYFHHDHIDSHVVYLIENEKLHELVNIRGSLWT